TLTKVQSELTSITDGIKGSLPVTSFMLKPTFSANNCKAGLETLLQLPLLSLTHQGSKERACEQYHQESLHSLSENGWLGGTQGIIEVV
ncbi:hypothetical protein BU17DRAFT_46373, partial [Hysterangium stoloniferum]